MNHLIQPTSSTYIFGLRVDAVIDAVIDDFHEFQLNVTSDAGNEMTHGKIHLSDRLQRLVFGSVLLLINVAGLLDSVDWKSCVALVLQLELLGTAVAGWCPITWGCHLRSSIIKNELT